MYQTLDNDEFLIHFAEHTDQRGTLTLTGNTQLPFDIQRVFWIHHTPQGISRGAHAHRTCAEVIVPVAGSFDVDLIFQNGQRRTYNLRSPHTGLLIPPMCWCELHHFTAQTVCLCLASESYDPDGYINDLKAFLAECAH